MSSVHLIASYDSFHFVQFRQCLNYIVFPIVTVLFISIDVVLYFSRFYDYRSCAIVVVVSYCGRYSVVSSR